jgi:hypothetical protein
MTHCETLSKVTRKAENKLSEYSIINCVNRQVEFLFIWLFNIDLEKTMRKIIMNPGGRNFNRSEQ